MRHCSQGSVESGFGACSGSVTNHLNDAPVISAIVERRKAVSPERALLVGISGIDGAGKGFIVAHLAESLETLGIRPAVINVDGWLNLPHVRFSKRDPAMHFYQHAIRFDEMFDQLVLPLRDNSSISVETDFAEETSVNFRRHRYDFGAVDIVLLEGIFLLKPVYRNYFDLTVWVDCSFKTALRRAVARGQEGLSPSETVEAFEAIYFPAQRIHMERDHPVAKADIVFCNDQPEKQSQ